MIRDTSAQDPVLTPGKGKGRRFVLGGLARLSLATAELGPLTRDVAAEDRVVAATVALRVQAGGQVKRGQVLLKIASPELTARLAQERANADALQSEWLRAQADSRQQRALAQSQLETAAIAHKTAQNDLARQTQAFQGGATAAPSWHGAARSSGLRRSSRALAGAPNTCINSCPAMQVLPSCHCRRRAASYGPNFWPA